MRAQRRPPLKLMTARPLMSAQRSVHLPAKRNGFLMKRRPLSLSALRCICALAVPAPTAHDVAKALVSLGPLDFFSLKTEALNTRHHAMNPTLGLLARTDFRLDDNAIYFTQDIEQKNCKTFKLNGKTEICWVVQNDLPLPGKYFLVTTQHENSTNS